MPLHDVNKRVSPIVITAYSVIRFVFISFMLKYVDAFYLIISIAKIQNNLFPADPLRYRHFAVRIRE